VYEIGAKMRMKKIIPTLVMLLIIIVLESCATAPLQNKTISGYNLDKYFEFENIPSKTLFELSQKWMWNNFGFFPSSIEYENLDKNELVAHIIEPFISNSKIMNYSCTLYCYIRENKTRMTIRNVFFIYPSNPHTLNTEYELKEVNDKFELYCESYDLFIKNSITQNNW
jgi:hypothetical protein